MKQADVVIGNVYQVKVSRVLKPVRIDSEGVRIRRLKARSYFNGTVLTTGRCIQLGAGRIRSEVINRVAVMTGGSQ